MKAIDWKAKLEANNISSDSLKGFRARICRINGYNSVSDIPLDKADDLIEVIAAYIESEIEFARYC